MKLAEMKMRNVHVFIFKKSVLCVHMQGVKIGEFLPILDNNNYQSNTWKKVQPTIFQK